MSTRATIVFIGPNGQGASATRLYQHCDGYPSNVLPNLKASLKAVRTKAMEHAETMTHRERGARFDFDTAELHVGLLTGAYIFEETTGFGMGAQLEESMWLESDDYAQFDTATSLQLFGNHGDIEWLYIVNSKERSIRVFGGGFGPDPQEMVENGMTDPMRYVDDMADDYKVKTAAQIRSACRSLSRAGFPVNPRRMSGRRAAHAAQRAARQR